MKNVLVLACFDDVNDERLAGVVGQGLVSQAMRARRRRRASSALRHLRVRGDCRDSRDVRHTTVAVVGLDLLHRLHLTREDDVLLLLLRDLLLDELMTLGMLLLLLLDNVLLHGQLLLVLLLVNCRVLLERYLSLVLGLNKIIS